MKQVQLLPAGVQQWSRSVFAWGPYHFAYCSTLAIYIFDIAKKQLKHIITGHERTITSIAWSPHSGNTLASCGVDKCVRIWDVYTGRQYRTISKLGFTPLCLEWDPHHARKIVVAGEEGACQVWDENGKHIQLRTDKNSLIQVFRFNKNVPDVFAYGSREGIVYVHVSLTGKRKFKYNRPDNPAVVDLQWDPLGSNYLLCAFGDGHVQLLDYESENVVQSFEKVPGGIRSIAWIHKNPGGFISTGERSGVIRVHNVSQKTPQSRLQVHSEGFQGLVFRPDSRDALCTFKDGTVGVYLLDDQRWDFKPPVGHTETVFDVQFCPANKDRIATASYDSSIRVWDLQHPPMKLVNTLYGHSGVVYCVRWAPSPSKHLISGTSTGEVFVWDTETGRVVNRLKGHQHAVYRVAWNQKQPWVASTSRGGSCIVSSPSGRNTHTYSHPKAVFGVDWSPTGLLLVTGCLDGKVRIWNVEQKSEQPQQILTGHSERVFNTVWSPLLPNRLMSGSDDKTIRVWDTSQSSHVVLKGHSANVRALLWSHEVPWLVFSGSWDGTIRLWDIRTQSCLKVIYDHHADVYGLSAHPARPFAFVSSSRDTSLRIWVLDEVVASVKVRLMSGSGADGNGVRGTVDESMATTGAVLLCGERSSDLIERLNGRPPLTVAQRIGAIADFFGTPCGTEDLWSLAHALNDPKNMDSVEFNTVPPTERLRQQAQHKISSLESVKMSQYGGGVGSAKQEDVLREAADLRLYRGDIKSYCDIMSELGEWDKALAVAPGVSLDYWRELSQRRVSALTAGQKGPDGRPKTLVPSDLIPHQLAIGQVGQAAAFFQQRREFDTALLVAQSGAEAHFQGAMLFEGGNAAGTSTSTTTTAGAEQLQAAVGQSVQDKMKIESQEQVRAVSIAKAKVLTEQGAPVLAACVLLAAREKRAAVRVLMQAGEVDLAATLAQVLKVPGCEYASEAMALRCERLGLRGLALSWLKRLRDPQVPIAMLCARYNGSDEQLEQLYTKAMLRSPSSYNDIAERCEKEKDFPAAIRNRLLARQPARAAKIGVYALRKLCSRPVGIDYGKIVPILDPLTSLITGGVDSNGSGSGGDSINKLRGELMAYAAYIGFQRAIWRQYHIVIRPLLGVVRHLVKEYGIDFPIHDDIMALQYARYLSFHDINLAFTELNQLEGSAVTEVAVGVSRLRALCTAHFRTTIPLPLKDNRVQVSGSLLPAGGNRKNPLTSLFTRELVQGPEVVLEDNHTVLALSEAIMWFHCTPFSPLMTGQRIFPY